jgi:hypothetical protein
MFCTDFVGLCGAKFFTDFKGGRVNKNIANIFRPLSTKLNPLADKKFID